MNENLTIGKLFDLNETVAGDYLGGFVYPWEALSGIGELILSIGKNLSEDKYEKRGDDIWIAKSAHVFESAYIKGPCIIGENTEVRHCAFIRGTAIVGKGAVVGNSTELKCALLFDREL